MLDEACLKNPDESLGDGGSIGALLTVYSSATRDMRSAAALALALALGAEL